MDLIEQGAVAVAHHQVQAAWQGGWPAVQEQAVAEVAAHHGAHCHIQVQCRVHHAGFHGGQRFTQAGQVHHLQVGVVGAQPFGQAGAANHRHPAQVCELRRVRLGVAAGHQGLAAVIRR